MLTIFVTCVGKPDWIIEVRGLSRTDGEARGRHASPPRTFFLSFTTPKLHHKDGKRANQSASVELGRSQDGSVARHAAPDTCILASSATAARSLREWARLVNLAGDPLGHSER